jgi:hypothetical protein
VAGDDFTAILVATLVLGFMLGCAMEYGYIRRKYRPIFGILESMHIKSIEINNVKDDEVE